MGLSAEMWRPAYHQLIVQLVDALATLLSFIAAYYLWILLRWQAPAWPLGADISFTPAILFIVAISAVIWVLIFDYLGAYSYQRFTSITTEIIIICKTVFLGSLLLIGLWFILRPGYTSRILVLLFIIANLILLTIEKLLLFYIAGIIRRWGKNRKVVLVIGTGGQARRFVDAIKANFNWGLDILGFLDVNQDKVSQKIFDKPILGGVADITSILKAHPLDEVIIAVSTRCLGEIAPVMEACEREGVQVRIISDFLGDIAKKIRVDVVYNLPVVSISYIPENKTALAIKRGMDIVISFVLLILLSPLMLLITLAIKLISPGPVFYQWNVVGFNKRPFTSWKFRTMVQNADQLKEKLSSANEMEGPVFKIRNDPRITPVGKILRKFSLDELPQLWSVLKGDMSLVGPRPASPHELARYESWHRRKLSIKPGITCLWQVNGRNRVSNFDDWVKMDLEYIDNWSIGLDIEILGRTLITVLRGTGY
jgi:exopolysaccharide biosynthesis polyprenyl glycosylphosphotransferase